MELWTQQGATTDGADYPDGSAGSVQARGRSWGSLVPDKDRPRSRSERAMSLSQSSSNGRRDAYRQVARWRGHPSRLLRRLQAHTAPRP